MADLTEEALEKALIDVWNAADGQGKKIALKPTRVYLTQYPHETDAMFEKRCLDSKNLLEKFRG